MSACNILNNMARQFASIFGESKRLIYAHASGSLVPGRTILCKLAHYPPATYFLARKLGCWVISYRNINAFFSWQFIGILLANLKLSLNRGNPTSLLNSYLTSPNDIFVLFCYPEGDKKSIRKVGAK